LGFLKLYLCRYATLLKLSPNPNFRNVALQCLAEIGGLAVVGLYKLLNSVKTHSLKAPGFNP
jgi:hypothetical protein